MPDKEYAIPINFYVYAPTREEAIEEARFLLKNRMKLDTDGVFDEEQVKEL